MLDVYEQRAVIYRFVNIGSGNGILFFCALCGKELNYKGKIQLY